MARKVKLRHLGPHPPSTGPNKSGTIILIMKESHRTSKAAAGAKPRKGHVRPMKREWASCSTRGAATFDKDLLQQPASFRAEAIARELLQLKGPNHGKVFKTLLREYLAAAQSR